MTAIWGYSSVTEPLPSMHKALSSVPSAEGETVFISSMYYNQESR